MINLKNILAISFLIIALGCKQPEVTFDEPQPENTKSLSQFAKRIQGEYESAKGESKLKITNDLITEIFDFDDKTNVNELDSLSRLSGNTIIDLKTKEKILITRVGDTLINHVHYVDTIFNVNRDNVLKKYRGYYFINIKYKDVGYIVKSVKLSKGILTISDVSIAIENLRKTTEIANDTISPLKFKPTKKEFKKFIKLNGFDEGKTFVKIKFGSS